MISECVYCTVCIPRLCGCDMITKREANIVLCGRPPRRLQSSTMRARVLIKQNQGEQLRSSSIACGRPRTSECIETSVASISAEWTSSSSVRSRPRVRNPKVFLTPRLLDVKQKFFILPDASLKRVAQQVVVLARDERELREQHAGRPRASWREVSASPSRGPSAAPRPARCAARTSAGDVHGLAREAPLRSPRAAPPSCSPARGTRRCPPS